MVTRVVVAEPIPDMETSADADASSLISVKYFHVASSKHTGTWQIRATSDIGDLP